MENPLKNILVIPPYYPPHIGGVERFSKDVHQELKESGFHITVFTPEIPHCTMTVEESNEATIIRFPAWEIIHNYPLPKLWSPKFWQLLRLARKNRPALVVSHTRFFLTSLLALVYARIHHIPLLHIEHGSSFVQSGNSFILSISRIYDETLGKLVIKKADRVVAISEEARRFVNKLCPNKHCDIIRRGFNSDVIEAIPEDVSLTKTPGVIRLMYTGRLLSGKGVHILMDALKNIPKANWELIVVGEGPERNALEILAKKLPKNHVKFLGEKNWEETIALLKTSDIFINPSFTEGLPTGVAEAALCNKAIIATDVGGTRELFTEESNDFLIPAKDPLRLAEKISLLINNIDLRNTLGDIEKRLVQKNFSWEKSINQFLNIFKELENTK